MIPDWLSLTIIIMATTTQVIWFYYYFGLYAFEPKIYSNFKGKVAVIVPIYNEDLNNLAEMVKGLNLAEGINEIVYVNDCSPVNGTINLLNRLRRPQDIIVDLKVNGGKRNAHKKGLEKVNPNIDVIVFVDSDTILKKDSVIELVKPFNDPELGGVTGKVLVMNEKENWITKTMASSWITARICRTASSNYGYVAVASGALSAYRKEYLDLLIDDYVNQTFMGSTCTISDDRWMTVRIQTKLHKRMEYCSKAIAYTYTSNSLITSYKMLLRWRKGALRETLLLYKELFNKPVLVLDAWLILICQVFARIFNIVLIAGIYFNPLFLIWFIGNTVISSLIYAMDLFFDGKDKIISRIGYSIINEFIYGWATLEGIIRVREQGKWKTR